MFYYHGLCAPIVFLTYVAVMYTEVVSLGLSFSPTAKLWMSSFLFCASSSVCQSTSPEQCCGVHVLISYTHPSLHVEFFLTSPLLFHLWRLLEPIRREEDGYTVPVSVFQPSNLFILYCLAGCSRPTGHGSSNC